MRSLIVGDGYLAAALAEQLERSGVSIERARRCHDSELALLLGAQHVDQVVVVPRPDGGATAQVVERVDGPRWVVCSWARDVIDSRSRPAEPARFAEEVALQRGGTVLRLSTVFGRGGDDDITRLARFVHRYRTIVRVENGDRLVQPLHVDDFVALVGGHLHRPSSGCFEIAGPETLPVAELWESVVEILGVRSRGMRVPSRLVRVLDRRGTGQRIVGDWGEGHARVDTRPARERFDWCPLPLGIRIEQGVHEAIA
jgi:hypothetical protein